MRLKHFVRVGLLFVISVLFSRLILAQGDDNSYLLYQLDDGSFFALQSGDPIRIGTLRASLTEHRVSPDAQFLLTSGNATIANLNGRNQLLLATSVDFATWSPDSQFFVLLEEDDNLLQIYTADGDLTQEINVPLDGRSVIDMDWGGERIAIATDDGLYGVEVTTGESRTLWDGGRVGFVDWSPDGEKLIFVRLSNTSLSGWLGDYSNRSINILNFTDGAPEMETIVRSNDDTLPEMGMGDVRWSPDGQSIAFIAYGIDMLVSDFPGLWLIVMDAMTYEVQARLGANNHLELADLYLYEFGWSPDSRAIAMNAFEPGGGGALLIYTLNDNTVTRRDIRTWTDSAPVWRDIPQDVFNTITEQMCFAVAPSGANLRAEPTSNGSVAGSLGARDTVQIDSQTERESFIWFHTIDNLWVRADVVTLEGDCEGLPTDLRRG